MDQLEYQQKLAAYEERIAYHKAMARKVEHEKARYVMSVLDATMNVKKKSEDKGISDAR